MSVVVPTHNRSVMLRRHLSALAEQTYPRSGTEWIVVCDGCQDDSAQVARESGADHVVEEPASGAAAARNTGLAAAQAPIVCFLDDDIIPSPGWLRALIDDLQPAENRVLHMGYCPFAPAAIISHLDRRNATWYEAKLRPLRDPAHAWRFTDFFGGNFAASRDELKALGGFDVRFRLFEDAELALRALGAGWRIRFVTGAQAEHHAHREPIEYGQQAFRSGQVDALFARIHPDAKGSLRLGLHRSPVKRSAGALWRRLAVRSGIPLRAVESGAKVAERFGLGPILDVLYPLIWDGQYWRGVAAA